MTDSFTGSEIDLALARSAVWEALALGFRPPEAGTVARLASESGAAALAEIAALLDAGPVDATRDDGSSRAGPCARSSVDDLASRARSLGRDPAPALDTLRAAHVRLFGHTARGSIAPYETEYGEDSPFLPAREMSDLAAFFRAFGLGLRPDAHERPDHIACECEFMLVLARKEAHALEIGDERMVQATRDAARLFLRDHLGRWAPGFGARLAAEDGDGFHGRLGDLCGAFVTSECRRAGVGAGPEFLQLRSPDADDAPMACGVRAPAPLA